MKASMKKKWMPMLGALLAVFGSFAALMYISITAFSHGVKQPGSPFFRFQQGEQNRLLSQRPKPASDKPVTHPANVSKIVLDLNRDHAVGKTILTFRGLEGRRTFRLDVRVPELDPSYTYPHKIKIDQARKGFQVGGEQLKLLSAGRSRIRLARQVPRQ
jgi:hypothetical protein